MCAAPIGKWIVVRSDRLILPVDKVDHLYSIGRSRQLPSSQLLSHKYASREQLSLVWHPPYLYAAQVGKNPTFLGPTCEPVPSLPSETSVLESADASTAGPIREMDASAVQQGAQLRFTASATTKEAVLHKGSDGLLEVEVPLSDPLMVTQAPDRHTITASTMYFPDEVGLPLLSIRFENADVARDDATAAATTKTAAEMLAVPAFHRVEEDEEEEFGNEDVQSRKPPTLVDARNGQDVTAKASNSKLEWRGLLDVVLQEQQLQDAARASEGQHNESQTAVERPSPLPPPVTGEVKATPPAPSSSIPFRNSSSKSTTDETAASEPSQQHHMGFWEWKQRVNGKDDDPKSWRKYNRAVAVVLEEAYRDPSIAKIKIPDSVMFDKPEAKGCTYGVCFAEKALNGAMIQYCLDDPGHFRQIRRNGGSPVDRKKAKKAHVIPSSSDNESESASEESFSDSDSEESVSSSSSSDSDEKPKKRRRH